MFLTIIFFAGLLFLPKISKAANYYVSTTGNDSNAGTQSQPWKTIQRAVNNVKAGDLVNIRTGVYNERVDLTGSSGSEGKSGDEFNGYITYQSYPGEKAILDGSAFSDWGSGFMSGRWTEGTYTVNYIQIKDLEIRNYPESAIVFDYATNEKGSHHIIIENVIAHHNGNVGIYIWQGTESAGTTHDVIIRNCQTYNNGDHGIKFNGDNPGVLNNGHIHDSLIENCISHDNTYIGIHVSTGNYNITVKNNTVFNNGRQGIAAHEVWASTYENNIVYGNGQGPDTEDQGIIIWRSKNLKVSGNLIYDNIGFGLTLWEDLSNTGSSPIIVNNVIRNNQGGGLLISTDVINGKVYNNTVVSNQGQGISIITAGHDIKNNILYQNANQLVPGSGNVFDYNLYYPDVSFSGKGIHSISADPVFVNIANYDYHPQPDSPTINSGTTISSVTTDYDGVSRPQGAGYDIGAYEYIEVSDITPPAAPSGVTIQ